LVDDLPVLLLDAPDAAVPDAAFFVVAAPRDEDALDEELELREAVSGELVACGVSLDVVVWARARFADVEQQKESPAKMMPERNEFLAKTGTAKRRTKVLPTDEN
jgi:hypothetical protein